MAADHSTHACVICGTPFPAKPRQIYCSYRCNDRARRAKAGSRSIADIRVASPNWRYCAVCCKHYYGRPGGTNTKAGRAAKRISKAARRARKRGAVVSESVLPRRVFERAGWRCQICGVKTPAKYRGTHRHDAPDLDHVVPLSKGGAHTYANVQCACRACNGWKSDKVIVGQGLLFG